VERDEARKQQPMRDVGWTFAFFSAFLKTKHMSNEVNKAALVAIEGLGLGIIGFDRLLVGDIAAFVVKLLSFGVFGIWGFIDYWIVMINALSKSPNAPYSFANRDPPLKWSKGSNETAFILALIFVVLAVVGSIVASIVQSQKNQNPERLQKLIDDYNIDKNLSTRNEKAS
jgi:TM2 domain-containing membrane protein YozV